MNCDQFERRMQELLDLRLDVRDDRLLDQHAATCPACRHQRTVWLRIGEALEPVGTGGGVGERPESDRPRSVLLKSETVRRGGGRGQHRRVLFSLLAISAVFVVMWTPYRPVERPVVSGRSIAESASAAVPSRLAGSVASRRDKGFRPEAWADRATAARLVPQNAEKEFALLVGPWQPDRWWHHVADDRWNALAGVDSVREGVAPIGRSVRRAMSILMTQVTRVPVSSPKPPAELPVDRVDEQTSDWTTETKRFGFA